MQAPSLKTEFSVCHKLFFPPPWKICNEKYIIGGCAMHRIDSKSRMEEFGMFGRASVVATTALLALTAGGILGKETMVAEAYRHTPN
jgi:hypothetical protein